MYTVKLLSPDQESSVEIKICPGITWTEFTWSETFLAVNFLVRCFSGRDFLGAGTYWKIYKNLKKTPKMLAYFTPHDNQLHFLP